MALKLNFENKKQIATILLAVGLGLMGVFLMGLHVENKITAETQRLAKDYQKKTASAQSVMAQDLQARDKKLREVLQKMEQRQKAQLEKVKQQAAQAAQAAAQAAARDNKESPGAGQEQDLVSNTRFSLLTPPGKRALTIVIDSLSAVGGLISAGDYVDIMAELMPDQGEEITSILFQEVQVLAVGSNFSPQSNSQIYQQQQEARSLNVTLAVDPEEVGLISFAQKSGKLRLVLRSPAEKGVEAVNVAAWESLSDYVLDRQGTSLSVPKKRKSSVTSDVQDTGGFVEIFRGGQAL